MFKIGSESIKSSHPIRLFIHSIANKTDSLFVLIICYSTSNNSFIYTFAYACPFTHFIRKCNILIETTQALHTVFEQMRIFVTICGKICVTHVMPFVLIDMNSKMNRVVFSISSIHTRN